MDLPAPYLILVALLVVGLIGGIIRWGLGPDSDRRKDYGLLREVAKVPSSDAARLVEQELQDAGIRATTVPADDGAGFRVLVFPVDERMAIDTLLRKHPD
ncbi:hypothetical protein [Alloactinosynnema sp. L-07]|uniref:hypothetical protein n=1 Tax=Alloactinosynnema sp. L-07 TaxID=1653480 RepID=UPI00065EF3EB|nr:hypothetical protein [Alloactinosynnema sp. L-07]CRK59120.1 hypothetical protein [Alloactinosynnema sp. L-07]